MTRQSPLGNRLALRVKEAAAALGVSERKFREVLPELPTVRMGSVVVVPVDLLREWLRERAESEPAKVDRAVKEVMDSFDEDLRTSE